MGKIIHPSAIGRPTTWMEDFTKIRQSPIPWMPTTHSLEGKRFLGKSQNALFRLQIWNTRAKPQWIAATRLLYHLQPSVLFKSSTKDLSLPIFEIVIQFLQWFDSLRVTIVWSQSKDISLLAKYWERWISSLSSMVSDLEAFSPKPTDGSFAALFFQTTAFTNCLNQGFLSY